ncbi:protein MIZU-KUSSEI 1-like [Neltuma alba]|uniref:protein MIZU-KUSSEI 1-like n=1 Tax=Neltuma alba TaxID=207710 RepID=UPI0010A3FF67|nr:protein MIZU-KUSSEI 1-like [Prosopis alba]
MGYPTADAVTGVECHKQVRSWRLLRSLIQVLIPTCNSSSLLDQRHQYLNPEADHNPSSMITALSSSCSSVISGTIFGYRHGNANLCIQEKPSSPTPLLLLHLPIPTTVLARQMRGGTLRMVLQRASITPRSCCCCSSRVLSIPLWALYCNGKKQGYAVKRKPESVDMEVLRLTRKVVAECRKLFGVHVTFGF